MVLVNLKENCARKLCNVWLALSFLYYLVMLILCSVGAPNSAVLYRHVVFKIEGLGAALYRQGYPKGPLEKVTEV